jgi:hypothetical protein
MWWSTRRAPYPKVTLNRSAVMPGLVPGIHVFRAASKGVDGRDKPGHDVQSHCT